MDEDGKDTPPIEWIQALKLAREDAAAGRIVSAEQVHDKFRKRLYDAFGERRVAQGSQD